MIALQPAVVWVLPLASISRASTPGYSLARARLCLTGSTDMAVAKASASAARGATTVALIAWRAD